MRITKKALIKDNNRLYAEINECYDTIRRLGRKIRKLQYEKKALYRANRALGEEVNFRQDKIDRVIRYCECKIRERKGTPAWLREVMAE